MTLSQPIAIILSTAVPFVFIVVSGLEARDIETPSTRARTPGKDVLIQEREGVFLNASTGKVSYDDAEAQTPASPPNETPPTSTPVFVPGTRDRPDTHPGWPNAFVAIHITNREAVLAAEQITVSMQREDGAIQPYLQPLNTLHFSIFNTHVSPQRAGLAREALTEASNQLRQFSLHLHGVRSFGSQDSVWRRGKPK